MTTFVTAPRTHAVSALVSRPASIQATARPTSAPRRWGFWMTLLRALSTPAA